jgi:hypothetical protein
MVLEQLYLFRRDHTFPPFLGALICVKPLYRVKVQHLTGVVFGLSLSPNERGDEPTVVTG